MKNTKFITLLITPSIDRGYVDTLPSRVREFDVDWIMYRSKDDTFVHSFVKNLSTKTLLLNLPFTSLSQILSLSASFGGVHLKSHLIHYIAPLKAAYSQYFDSQKIIGFSAHSINEIESALELGADYCTLSPIFATPNKPAPLGLEILEQIPYDVRSRVIALGGITNAHIPALKALGLGGYAGIRCFT